MRRFLLALLVALAVVAPAGAWTWPADGPVLQPFSFDPEQPKAPGFHRGIDVAGPVGRSRARARRGRRLVRRHGARQRQVRDDRDRGRLVGDAHPPGLHRCDQGRVGRRGRRRRDDRSERRVRGERSPRPPRRPQDERRVRLRRPGERAAASPVGRVESAPVAASPDAVAAAPAAAGQPPVDPGAVSSPAAAVAPASSRGELRLGPVVGRVVAAGLAASRRRPAGSRERLAGAVRVAARRRSGGRSVEPAPVDTVVGRRVRGALRAAAAVAVAGGSGRGAGGDRGVLSRRRPPAPTSPRRRRRRARDAAVAARPGGTACRGRGSG